MTHFSLAMYFKVLDSYMYGGKGTEGYITSQMDFIDKNDIEDIPEIIKGVRKSFAEMLEVDEEKVISISRMEYEDNTEEDSECEQ